MHDLYGDIKISVCISTSEFSGSMLEKLKKFVANHEPQITELPQTTVTDTCDYSYFIAVAQAAMAVVHPDRTNADRWDVELLLHCYKIYTLGWAIITQYRK